MKLDLETLKSEAEKATGEDKAQKTFLIKRVEKSIEKLTFQQEEEKKAVENSQKAPETAETKTPSATIPVILPNTTAPVESSVIKAELPEKIIPAPEIPNTSPVKTGEDMLKGVEKGLIGTELTAVNDNLEKLFKMMLEKEMGTTVIAGNKKESSNIASNYSSSRVLSLRDQLRPA
jgi:hypothetical protein